MEDRSAEEGKKGNAGAARSDPMINFLAGTAAGMSALVVGYPFDTVKVRFQTPETRNKYTSTINAISTIIREERFRGLYKGIASPMALYTPLNGVVFAGFGFMTRIQLKNESDEPTLTQLALAGVGTGMFTCWITCPTELVKIREQNVIYGRTSTIQVALDIFRRHGVRGLYRGITTTALRESGYGAYFSVYEGTCRLFREPVPDCPLDASGKPTKWHVSIPALLFAGGVAGVVSWASTFPFDVIKTRVQSVDYQAQPPHVVGTSSGSASSATVLSPRSHSDYDYRTTWSTIVHSYRSEGLPVFFRGLMPTIVRAFPVNMVTFAMYEAVVHVMS